MSKWNALISGLGFADNAREGPAESLSPGQIRGFTWIRWLFGLIWLYAAWTASSGATRHALAAFLGLPFASPWVHLAGTAILFLDLYLALALLSGRGLRLAFWIGVIYLLVMWLLVERGGDFNPAAGGTDAGIAPPYLLLLVFVWAVLRTHVRQSPDPKPSTGLYWAHATRVMFGFLWAWDALYKLRPYFLTHFTQYLVAAEPGQPAWIVAYLHGWIFVIGSISPLLFAILTALIEVAVALSLLTGRCLRVGLPLGLVFSLLIWTTAEGFGGPYGNGTTGMPGNMFGTAIIYAILFAGLMIFYGWPRNRDHGCLVKVGIKHGM